MSTVPSPASTLLTGPTARLSFTDPTTWIMIFTAVAAIVLDVFHKNVGGYVDASATVAAGLVLAFGLLAKHNLQGAIHTAAGAVAAGIAQAPAGAPAVIPEVGQVLSLLATVVPATPAPAPVVPAPAPAPPPSVPPAP